MAQLLLMNAGNELQLYVSPVNWKPDAPPSADVLPVGLSPATCSTSSGYYRTLGWAEATWPLNEAPHGRTDVHGRSVSAPSTIARRSSSTGSTARQWDLLVGVIESTDRVQHMMWRLIDPKHPMYDAALAAKFGGAIESVYRRADDFIGEVMERVDPGTPILVVSDHGFHSWRKAVNLNTWLVQNGYMTLQGQRPADKKLDDLFGGGHVLGERRLDADPRLRHGHRPDLLQPARPRIAAASSAPAPKRASWPTSSAAKLLTMTDPDDGAPIIRSVYKRDDIYSGEFLQQRVRAAGRHARGLSRLVADDARRVAGRPRLPEHEEVERRSRRLRLRDDGRRPDRQPAAHHERRRRSWTSRRRC